MLAQTSTALTARLTELSHAAQCSADQYLRAARAVLVTLVTNPEALDFDALPRKEAGFTRNLIHAGDGLSIWAMVWSPGAATPIHDHHCSCCFGMISGALRERWYQAIDADRAIVNAESLRKPGYIACMMPTGPNIHQMLNDSTEDAISIHIYGYDHEAHTTSIDRVYQLAAS